MINLKEIHSVFARFSRKEKLILSVACVCVVLALVDRMVVAPIISKLDSLKGQIRQKEETIKRNLHIVSQKERVEHEVQKFSSYFNALASEEENVTVFLKELEALANKSSLSIVDMKPAGIKEDDNKVKKCVVTLSGEGQMEQIMDFMYNVENSSSLLTVERYQINPKSRETSVAQCSMTISKILM
jgi:Tfp pilus assembly protein PilO